MNLPALIFVQQIVPDHKLENTFVYKYLPISEMKEQILQGLKDHTKIDLEEYIVDINIEIVLKKYNTTPIKKEFYYEKQINDTKNT